MNPTFKPVFHGLLTYLILLLSIIAIFTAPRLKEMDFYMKGISISRNENTVKTLSVCSRVCPKAGCSVPGALTADAEARGTLQFPMGIVLVIIIILFPSFFATLLLPQF